MEGCCASEQEATGASSACTWRLDIERNASTSLRFTRNTDLKRISGFCTKPWKVPKLLPTLRHRVLLHKPMDLKKILSWSRCFKKEEEILETISSEVLDAAKTRSWMKASYLMVVLAVAGGTYVVSKGNTCVFNKPEPRKESLPEQEAAMKAKTERKHLCWTWKI